MMTANDILPIGWVEDYFIEALQRWANRIPDQYREQLFGNILPAPKLEPLGKDFTIRLQVAKDHPISDDPLSGRVFVFQGKNNQNKTQRLLLLRIAMGAPIDQSEKQHLMASDDYSLRAFDQALRELFSGDTSLSYEMSCGKALYQVEISRRKVLAKIRDADGNELPPIEREFKGMDHWQEFCSALRDANLARVKFVSRSRSFLHHVAVSTVDRYLLVLEQFKDRAHRLENYLSTGGKESLSDQELSRRSRELREMGKKAKDELATQEAVLSQTKLVLGTTKAALSRLQRLEGNADFRVYLGSLSHLRRSEAEFHRMESLRVSLERSEALLETHKEQFAADDGRVLIVEEAANRLNTGLDRRGDRIRKLKSVQSAIQAAAVDRNIDLLVDYERTLGAYTPETLDVLRKLVDLPVWNDLSAKMQVPSEGDIDSPKSITYLRDEVKDLYYTVAESIDLFREVHECVSALHEARITTSQQFRDLTKGISQLREQVETLDMEVAALKAEVSALSESLSMSAGTADVHQQVDEIRARLAQEILDEWRDLSETLGVLIPRETPEENYSQALIKKMSELTASVTQLDRHVQTLQDHLRNIEIDAEEVAGLLKRNGSPEGSARQEINAFRLRLISLSELLEHYRNSIVVNPALVRVVLESQNDPALSTTRGNVSRKQAKMAEALTPQDKYQRARNELGFLAREAMDVLKKAMMQQIPFAFGANGRKHPIVDLDIEDLTARFDGLEVSGGATSALALWAWANEPTDHIFRTVFLVDEVGDLNSLVDPLFGELVAAAGFGFAAMARNVNEPFSRQVLITSEGGMTP